MRDKDWADLMAEEIMLQAAWKTPREYEEHLKQEIEGRDWQRWEYIPAWCGTEAIASRLRLAFAAGRRAGIIEAVEVASHFNDIGGTPVADQIANAIRSKSNDNSL